MANQQMNDIFFNGANHMNKHDQPRDSRLQNPSEPLQGRGFGANDYENAAHNPDMTAFQLVQSVIQPPDSSSMGSDTSFRSVSPPSFT